MHVALAADSALRNYRTLARDHEVGDYFFGRFVGNNRARRNPNDEVVALMTILLLAAAGFAVARDQPRLVLEIEQSRESLIALEDNAPAPASIAARRSAEGAEFFAQE